MRAEYEAYPLLSVEEAQRRVLSTVSPLDPEGVDILDATHRVLAEDVHADMDVPPLDNSAMDGYAIRAQDLALLPNGSPVRLRVVAELAAGHVADRAVGSGEAIRIMTGAPMPNGADTVVRFEDTRQERDRVEILVAPQRGRNVRQAGEDVREGQIVLRRGIMLSPAAIGMLASVGRNRVRVARKPRVAILATGDEVAAIDQPARPGQIRNINSFSNAAQVIEFGGQPMLLGITGDRVEDLVLKIREGLDAGADLFVTSGGVSVGDFDLVKQVLIAEGEIGFWWINMKPGKPMAFGQIAGVPMLGLPGNPVAAMVSFRLFGRPAILKMLGAASWRDRSVFARLREPISRKDGRRHYLRVRLDGDPEDPEAVLTGDQGSGILTSMVQADGLAVIPEDRGHLPAGTKVRVILLD